jgi:hypothetical protein
MAVERKGVGKNYKNISKLKWVFNKVIKTPVIIKSLEVFVSLKKGFLFRV